MKHHQSLVELLGGVHTVRVAVDMLYQRILIDPKLMTFFESVDLVALRGHMTASLVSVLSATADTGAQTAEANRLRDAHAYLDITDDAFDRTAGHLLDVLAELGVDPTLIDDAILRVAALRPLIVGEESAHQTGRLCPVVSSTAHVCPASQPMVRLGTTNERGSHKAAAIVCLWMKDPIASARSAEL